MKREFSAGGVVVRRMQGRPFVAVVRVRAANETVARRVLPSVLSSPGTVDIKVANENNAALGVDALVTDVDFAIEGGVTLFEVDGTIITQG